MIYHNLHTMSLDRCSLMFDTEDSRLVARYRFVPTKRAYKRFVIAFGKMFNEREISKMLRDEKTQIDMFNYIHTTLPGLSISLLFLSEGEDYEALKEFFKEQYGREFKGGEDLVFIDSECKKLQKKYRVMYGVQQKEDEDNKGLDLKRLVAVVSTILGFQISGTTKVYQFKGYYDMALDKIESQKDG